MDIVSLQKRSEMMSGIHSKNTKPEIIVRKYLHNNGFRYRLYTKINNFSPDIVLRKYKVAIFVHGCFWHRHQRCKYMTTPKTNTPQWQLKFETNISRDFITMQSLLEAGWRIAVIWECWEKRKLDISWLGTWITTPGNRYVSWPELSTPDTATSAIQK